MIQTTIEKLIHDPKIQCFLVDASGVLYDDNGLIDGAANAVKAIQKLNKHLFVVTNNTSIYVTDISEKLAVSDIDIAPENIISSGRGLLLDAKINALIKDKVTFVFGYDSSHPYTLDAGCAKITDNLYESEVVVMSASYAGQDALYTQLLDFAKTHPDVPIICPNPDRYVQTDDIQTPVVGFYAAKLEQKCQRPVIWIGKPYDNFSILVKNYIHSAIPKSPESSWCFIDDNIENVHAMCKIINLTGCTTSHTGLSNSPPITDFLLEKKAADLFVIPQFG